MNHWERCFLSQWRRRLGRQIASTPNRSRTYDPLLTSPDALPLSYRRLVGAKATKLGSTSCIPLGLECRYVHTRNDRDAVMVNFKSDPYMRKMFISQWHRRLGRKIPSTYLSLVNYTWHREPNQPIRSRNISVMSRPVLVLLLVGR